MPRKQKSAGKAAAKVASANHTNCAAAAHADGSLPGDQTLPAGKAVAPVSPGGDLETVIAQIRYWHRQRVFAMEQRKRIDLALGAFLRMMLGWRKDLPDAERKAIAQRAQDLLDNPFAENSEWESVIAASTQARGPFATIEAKAVKEMSALAASLPVWPAFGEPIRGFGQASLAVIVAEAGDLSMYANPGKLWKRMGLAVMGDVRQGGLAKGASAAAWIEHGYSPARRSRMWNIGDALIKGNRDGEYRCVYLQRKAYELARDPEMQPIKAHRRAQRYMEKRLLRDLWRAWRRASVEVNTEGLLPAAARSASAALTSDVDVPSASTPAKAGKRRAASRASPDTTLPAATSSAQAERSAILETSTVVDLPSAAALNEKLGTGRIGVNQARDEYGLPPLPGGGRKRRVLTDA
jgi:hypothetical protein